MSRLDTRGTVRTGRRDPFIVTQLEVLRPGWAVLFLDAPPTPLASSCARGVGGGGGLSALGILLWRGAWSCMVCDHKRRHSGSQKATIFFGQNRLLSTKVPDFRLRGRAIPQTKALDKTIVAFFKVRTELVYVCIHTHNCYFITSTINGPLSDDQRIQPLCVCVSCRISAPRVTSISFSHHDFL